MVKTMKEIDLKSIITQYPESLDNPKMLKGLIFDLYPQCSHGMVVVIISIASDGIMQEIQNAGKYSDIMLSRWVTRLENNYGYSEKISKSKGNGITIQQMIEEYKDQMDADLYEETKKEIVRQAENLEEKTEKKKQTSRTKAKKGE